MNNLSGLVYRSLCRSFSEQMFNNIVRMRNQLYNPLDVSLRNVLIICMNTIPQGLPDE